MTLQELRRIFHLQKTTQMSPMDSDGVVVDAGGKVDEVKVGGGRRHQNGLCGLLR